MKMTASINWIHNLDQEPSIKDKLKTLLQIGYKLVLVQLHELERLIGKKLKDNQVEYIGRLYEHYVTRELPKTYISHV